MGKRLEREDKERQKELEKRRIDVNTDLSLTDSDDAVGDGAVRMKRGGRSSPINEINMSSGSPGSTKLKPVKPVQKKKKKVQRSNTNTTGDDVFDTSDSDGIGSDASVSTKM